MSQANRVINAFKRGSHEVSAWKQLLCCKKRAAEDLVNKNLRLTTAKTRKEEAAEDSDEKNYTV